MIILKKILRKLYHFIAFLSVFFIVSPRVNAIVNINGTDFVQSPQVNFYDNTNGRLTSVGAGYHSSPYEQWVSSSNLTTNGANTDGANIAFTINSSFVSGYTYALSVLIGMEGGSLKASNSRVCVAENLTNASIRYSNTGSYPCANAFAKVTQDGYASYTTPNGNSFRYGVLTIVFTADFTAPSITFAYQSVGSNSSAHTFGGYHLEVLAQPINGLTQQQVQSIINNSGLASANSVSQVQSSINQIQQDINSSANNIINNNNQNTQDVIDNQNSNTDKQIESEKVCKYVDKSAIKVNGWLAYDGGIEDNSSYGVTDYILVTGATLKMTDFYGNGRLLFYDSSKNKISNIEYPNISSNTEITIPQNAKYVRFCINKDLNKPIFELCFNGNQSLDNSVNSLTDSITDSNVDSSDDTINNLKNRIPTNSVISDLLLLPVRFLQNFVNALGSSCSRFSLGSLYGTELFMPCINIESYLGNAIWTTIDLIISGLFVYSLRKKFIQIYENLTNLKNGGNEVD